MSESLFKLYVVPMLTFRTISGTVQESIYTQRQFTFIGEAPKSDKVCRAKLANGMLCPRRDFHRFRHKFRSRVQFNFPAVLSMAKSLIETIKASRYPNQIVVWLPNGKRRNGGKKLKSSQRRSRSSTKRKRREGRNTTWTPRIQKTSGTGSSRSCSTRKPWNVCRLC